MEDRIRVIGRTAWWLVGIFLAFGMVLLVGWSIRVVIPPLVLAGAITFLLNPVVTRLHRRGFPRVVGTATAYAVVIGVLVIIGAAMSPLVEEQVALLSDQWPEVRSDVEDRINDLSRESIDNDWPIQIPSVKELEDIGDQNGGDQGRDLTAQVTSLTRLAGRVFHVGLIFLLGPIIAFYLLMDLPHIRRVTEEMLPEGSRDEFLLIGHRLNLAVGGFFRGQLAVAAIVGVMVSLGLLAIGLPGWLIVGMIAGLFNMIPLIGPYVGAIPGIVIALTQKDLKTALLVVVVMVVAQQIDNHFISPVVMKRAVHLHPAAVMLALLVGGTVAGFFGLLIAVPFAAALKIVGGHLWRKYVLGTSVPGLDEALVIPSGPYQGPPPDPTSGAHRAMGPTDEPESTPAAPSSGPGGDPRPDGPTPGLAGS
jgi:predicted PurR-regulated permease PerM